MSLAIWVKNQSAGVSKNYWAHARKANHLGVQARGSSSEKDNRDAATAHNRAARIADKMGRPDRAKSHREKAKIYTAVAQHAAKGGEFTSTGGIIRDDHGRFAAK